MVDCLQLTVAFVYGLPQTIFMIQWPLPLEKAGCFNLPPQQLSPFPAFSWREGEQPLERIGVPQTGVFLILQLWYNLPCYISVFNMLMPTFKKGIQYKAFSNLN